MIQDLIDALTNKVNLAVHDGMTPEQESYAAGMADALEVVKDYDKKQLVIGRIYYVIINESDGGKFHLTPMKLYKINTTPTRTTYCFRQELGRGKIGESVFLFGKYSLMNRVFPTLEAANEGMKAYTPFDPELSKYRRR